MTKLESGAGSKAVAEGIVEYWMEAQLRPEGRKGIYYDDEAMLILAVSEALMRERKAGFALAVEWLEKQADIESDLFAKRELRTTAAWLSAKAKEPT